MITLQAITDGNIWRIDSPADVIGFRAENETDILKITGEFDPDYTYHLDLRYQIAENVVLLTKTEDGLEVVLTASMLRYAGTYEAQLRAVNDKKVKRVIFSDLE